MLSLDYKIMVFTIIFSFVYVKDPHNKKVLRKCLQDKLNNQLFYAKLIN